jgi:hypothetical protein
MLPVMVSLAEGAWGFWCCMGGYGLGACIMAPEVTLDVTEV